MATEKKKLAPTPITEADIEALQKVLDDVKAGAREAHSKGNLTTFRVYQKLAKVVSPEVTKAHYRKEREDLARMNKDGLAMKDGRTAASSGT